MTNCLTCGLKAVNPGRKKIVNNYNIIAFTHMKPDQVPDTEELTA